MTKDEMRGRLAELEAAQASERQAVEAAQHNILVRAGRILELKRALEANTEVDTDG